MSRPTIVPIADRRVSLPPVTLVLGGACSGKSAYAESLLDGYDEPVYVATAQAEDAEMVDRIRRHQARRGERWLTVEEPLDLVAALDLHSRAGRPLLIDCLTLWVTNLILARLPVDGEIDRLCFSLASLPGPTVLVSNEVGLGIVPDNAMARAFRDHAGRLNQMAAARSQRVVFVAAGLPLLLKDVR